jgi:hypothetical protein
LETEVSQEDVVALLDKASTDETFRARLGAVGSADALGEVAAALGFPLRSSLESEVLTDADLDGIVGSATNHTCRGTTDCCPGTNRTCRGTTDCCR